MIYPAVALSILVGVALWLYATNRRRTNEHVAAELSAPAYDPPRRQPQTVAAVTYAPVVETVTPTGAARSLQADVAVPMAQAAFSGVVGAILAAMLAANLHFDGVLSWALGGFALGLAGVWALNLWQSNRLLVKVERVIQRDINGDGHIGQPPDSGHVLLVNPDRARAQVAQSQAETARRVKTSDLLTFWARCHAQGTAQRAHGVEAGSGAALGRYEEMRDTLFRLGLAEWKNPASVKAGWRVVGDMAEGGALLGKHVKEQRHST